MYNPTCNCTIGRKLQCELSRDRITYRNYFPKLTSNRKSGTLLSSLSVLVATVLSGQF